MIEIKASNKYILDDQRMSIFLAGSIEMGVADNWQTRVVDSLKELDILILNPRRDDWDSSWKQTIDDPKFREQVEWELNALERVDLILMYFDPNTKSPISLLELGLFAETGKLLVCCPDGFWRKGNVDIVCKRYDIATERDINNCINIIKVQHGYHSDNKQSTK